jgi:hypothetical protein
MSEVLDAITNELQSREPDVVALPRGRDSAPRLLEDLPSRYPPDDLVSPDGAKRTWELLGLYHFNSGRVHEAWPSCGSCTNSFCSRSKIQVAFTSAYLWCG